MANTNLVELFTDIADSIRAKDGTTETIAPVDFASRIEAIPTNTGETEFKYRTPDEIYEQDRPSDWPILPDPEEGECYYLMKYNKYKDTVFYVSYHDTMLHALKSTRQETYFGYIDENGEFVSVYGQIHEKGDYNDYGSWGRFGLTTISEEQQEKMKPYYVIKTVDGIAYRGETFSAKPTSSRLSYVDSGGVTSENILEIKVNIPEANYILNNYQSSTPDSSYISYGNLYPNLQFITLYNGTGKNLRLGYLCYNKYALRCIRFDKEENNIFTNGTYTAPYNGEVAKDIFYGATSLQCMYPIDKLQGLTDISYLYYNNRQLPYLEIHHPTVTIAKYLLSNSWYAEKVSVILPGIINMNNFSLGNSPAELVNFQLPALNATSSFTIFNGIRSSQVLPTASVKNVNLLNKYSYRWADQTTGAIGAITFTSDCPPPDGVTIDCRAFTKKAFQEMVDTLPIASGAALTIELSTLKPGSGSASYLSNEISQIERDDFAQQITDKGYTVSIVV